MTAIQKQLQAAQEKGRTIHIWEFIVGGEQYNWMAGQLQEAEEIGWKVVSVWVDDDDIVSTFALLRYTP